MAVTPSMIQNLDNVVQSVLNSKNADQKFSKVPRILWKSSPVLDRTTRAVLSRIAQHEPEWQVIFMDDRACHAFMQYYFAGKGGAFEAYETLIPGAFKSDLFRACLLHRYGGIWSDIKQKYIVPLDAIFDVHMPGTQLIQDIFVPEPDGSVQSRIYNALFAASPQSGYLKVCINTILDHVGSRYTGTGYATPFLAITGPYAWQKAFESFLTRSPLNAKWTSDLMQMDDHVRIIGQLHLGDPDIPANLRICTLQGDSIVIPKFFFVPSIVSGTYRLDWINGRVYKS